MQDIFVRQIEARYDDILRQLEDSGMSGYSLMKELTQRYVSAKCLSGGKPFPTFLKPAFISETQMADIRRITNIIMKCLEKVSNLFFEDARYRSVFELAPGETELASVRTRYPQKVQHARLDAFITDGKIQFCEFNCDTPGGPGYSDIQVDLLLNTPPMIELSKEYDVIRDRFMQNVLDSLLDCYRYYGWDGSSKPRILIHTLFDLDPTMEELYVLQNYFQSCGHECIVAQPQDCSYEDGVLMVAGRPVELVYRRGATQWWLSHKDKYTALWNAYSDGAICMANPLNSKLAGKKSLMAVLQSETMQSKLTDEEKEVVVEHIPWTRIVEDTQTTYRYQPVSILDFLRENRENMVMKPIGLYGGKNVSIGREMNPKDWNDAIQTAARERYVAQEYIPIPEISLPVFTETGLAFTSKKVNMNFFAFNGEYAGGMARVSDSSIINISAGGGLIPILLAKEKTRS
ncbi:circularly permuted type 2 ATP-grasp protein [bacterium]|nr:circularly permuted type 2 ATP-grasp protein [candidate division CSSED10-310 bacterium]